MSTMDTFLLPVALVTGLALLTLYLLRLRRRLHAARRPLPRLGLLAIFKNESVALQQWLEHYRAEGVDRFFLIDNASTDQFMPILEPYLAQGIVQLVHDPRRHAQRAAYNDAFLPRRTEVDWLIVADLDEFLYSRPGRGTSLKAYLAALGDKVGQVRVPWTLFGSAGHVQQPPSIVHGFTYRARKRGPEHKYIVRTAVLQALSVHEAEIAPGFRTITESRRLQLNHYAIQSYEWFMKVKRTRGDAVNAKYDTTRDEAYFRRYDLNDVRDVELAGKRGADAYEETVPVCQA